MLGVSGCRHANVDRAAVERADAAVANGGAADPLAPGIVLRSNGDFLHAQDAAESMLTTAFHKIDQGLPLNEPDRINLLRGARLCAAMAAYLPGEAEGQDFKCGEALAALGYHDEAIRRYRMVLASIGDHPTSDQLAVIRADAYALMAVSLTAQKRFKAALDALAESFKAYPNVPAYYVDRAGAELGLGQAAKAKKDLESALHASKPGDPAINRANAMLASLATPAVNPSKP